MKGKVDVVRLKYTVDGIFESENVNKALLENIDKLDKLISKMNVEGKKTYITYIYINLKIKLMRSNPLDDY